MEVVFHNVVDIFKHILIRQKSECFNELLENIVRNIFCGSRFYLILIIHKSEYI